jgi:hypothetical protein
VRDGRCYQGIIVQGERKRKRSTPDECVLRMAQQGYAPGD